MLNLVQTTDDFIAGQNAATTAVLRFGHAETPMPLLSLLKIPGCYYLTNYFDTVAQHWCDFDVVPMAANIQFVLFKAKRFGQILHADRTQRTPRATAQRRQRHHLPLGRGTPIYDRLRAYLRPINPPQWN